MLLTHCPAGSSKNAVKGEETLREESEIIQKIKEEDEPKIGPTKEGKKSLEKEPEHEYEQAKYQTNTGREVKGFFKWGEWGIWL